MSLIFNISYSVFVSSASKLHVYYVERTNGSYYAACGNNELLYACNITEAGDITDFETDIQPDATLVVTEDDALASASLASLFVTDRFDIQETVIYTGKAPAGTADNAVGWTIKKITLVGGDATDIKTTIKEVAIWNDRATETYY